MAVPRGAVAPGEGLDVPALPSPTLLGQGMSRAGAGGFIGMTTQEEPREQH